MLKKRNKKGVSMVGGLLLKLIIALAVLVLIGLIYFWFSGGLSGLVSYLKNLF